MDNAGTPTLDLASFIDEYPLYELRHYLDSDGRDRFSEWLAGLRDPVAKIQIVKRVNRLEHGNFGDHSYCRDGVWEMRIDVGAGYRVYYALANPNVIVFLCAGTKKTQQNDIDRAVHQWHDWLQRS